MVPRPLLSYNDLRCQVSHVRKSASHSESVLPLRRPELWGAKRRERPLVDNVEFVRRLRIAGDASGAVGRKTGGAGRRDACLRRGVRAETAVAVHGQRNREPYTEKQRLELEFAGGRNS